MLIELEESLSLPIPLSLPMPMSISMGGISGASGGRATGRLDADGPDGFGRDAELEGFELELLLLVPRRPVDRLPSSRPARLSVLLLPRRLVVFFVVVDFALARVLPPRLPRVRAARLAVIRFGLALDFVVDRLPVDFFAEDFFFAAIDPPLGCTTQQIVEADVVPDDRLITCDL